MGCINGILHACALILESVGELVLSLVICGSWELALGIWKGAIWGKFGKYVPKVAHSAHRMQGFPVSPSKPTNLLTVV